MGLKKRFRLILGSVFQWFKPTSPSTTTSSPAPASQASTSVEFSRDSGTVPRNTYNMATTTLALAPALAAGGAILGSFTPAEVDKGAKLARSTDPTADTTAINSTLNSETSSLSGTDIGTLTLWQLALERLKPEDKEGIDFGKDRKLDLLHEFVRETERKKRECEEKQWGYKNSRGEKVPYAEGLLIQLGRYVAIGDIALQHNPDIVALAWAGFRIILQVATAGVRNMRLIFESLEYLVCVLSRCDIYEKIYAGRRLKASELLRTSLTNLYVSILEYLCYARRKLSGTSTTRFLKSIFSDLGLLFQRIQEREKDVANDADTAEKEAAGTGGFWQEERMKNLKRLLVEIQDQNNSTGRVMMDIYTYVEKEKRLKILMWLSDAPFQDHHSFLRAGRHDDTGHWLLQNEKFLQWKNSGSSSILWLRGDAGSGKTVLASKVIDEFQPQESTEEHALVYFYCSYREAARRDPASILRALIKQFCLIIPQDELPTPVLSIYREREDNGHISGPLDLNESKNLIIELSEGFLQSTVVIDALDECDRSTRRDLLRILKEIVTLTNNVRIFVTGRNDGDICNMLFDSPSYYINAADNTTDIDTYVKSEVERCFKERLLPNDEALKDEVIKIISAGANGMFMWAHFQILAICEEHTPGHVRNALERLPKDLDETYARILKRINGQSQDVVSTAKKVLKWLLYVKELNSPEIISEFLSVKPGEATLADTWTKAKILDICQNLVVYDKELNVLRFTHFSVQEFLLSQSEFSPEEGAYTHMTAAEVCLTVLTYHHSETQNCRTPALLEYATSNWAARVRLLNARSSTLENLLKQFIDTSQGCYRAWVSRFSGTEYGVECEGVLLKEAFDRQLYDLFEFLLDNDVIPHCSDYCLEGILYHAAERGCHDFVQLLVAKQGVDINYKVDGSTPLHCATRRGHVKVVQMLLGSKEIDPNSRGTDGFTPLALAVCSGKPEVVQILLDKDKVALDSKDNIYNMTPASLATLYRYEEIMQMILEKGEVDFEDAEKALSWAVSKDKDKIVRALLEKSPLDFECFQRALFLAASQGSGNVVRLLLEKGGVDLGGTQEVLSLAAERGAEKVVQILLENGEMNQEGVEKARSLAAARGHGGVVWMLKEALKGGQLT